jgi:hypothetical protein
MVHVDRSEGGKREGTSADFKASRRREERQMISPAGPAQNSPPNEAAAAGSESKTADPARKRREKEGRVVDYRYN